MSLPPIPSISDIQSGRTRSLLRGLLTRNDDSIRTAYDNLRSSTSTEDIEAVSLLLIESPLFSHLDLPEDFPGLPRSAHSVHCPIIQSLEHELVFQGLRIKKNEQKLARALDELVLINKSLIAEDFAASISAIKHFVETFGYSLLVLNKLSYLSATCGHQAEVKSFCAEELAKYGAGRRNGVALASMDMMGVTYPYLQLRRNLLDFVAGPRVSKRFKDIISWQFRPIRFAKSDVASQLQSHGLVSLIDVLHFICVHRFNVEIFSSFKLNAKVDDLLGPALSSKWRELSEAECPSTRISFRPDDEPELNDFIFYRRSLAWLEYKNVSLFRNGVDHYFIDNKSKPLIRNVLAAAFSESYFCGVTKLVDIADAPSQLEINLDRYDNKVAGSFFRTLAFIHLLRSGARAEAITANQLLCLLNNTMIISEIAQVGELRDFFGPPSSDLLVRYLAEAVIWDCSGKNIDQHSLRRSTQDIIIHRFGGDIVAFAQYLALNSRYVALHFFNMCTEPFLVLLFYLFPQPEMVFEARAKLLDWYGEHFKEPLALERAKTLRLDQRLQKIRGDIDDTRIYVDPLRFGQWLQDSLLDELANLLQAENISITDIRAFTAFGDFATNREPHIRLAVALQTAFHEFCVNKRYGVDSYLGRRIRHGTLKGVMLTQVQAILRKPKYAPLLQQTDANNYLDQWVSRYELKIAEWGQEIFQIWSKQKHHGAISTDITGSDKIESTKTALVDLVTRYQETKSVAAVLQAIFEHCWRLLEKDLSQIRMFIESQRLEWGTINRTELRATVTDEGLKTLAAELAREINTLTEEKFRGLSRWFTKPTNLAPSASISLLLDAVLSEVKEHFPAYAPEIRRAGLSDVELFGMYYHHVYDFLNVVIYNAAKHGKRSGLLVQDIQIRETAGPTRLLQLSISSEKKDDESIETVKTNINSAMSGSTDDAMVIEGHSGIKKLIRLSSDVKEISDFGVSFDGGLIRFNLSLELAPS